MKLSRLQRVLRLIALLQSSRHCRPEELAEKLEVSRRTIFRDLDLLRKVGIPYYYDDKKSGYHINSHYLLPPLNLNMMEALSLLLTTQHSGGACKVPLRQPTQQAGAKIAVAIPGHIQHHCGAVLKDTSMRCAAHVQNMGQDYSFAVLQKAIRQRHKVKMTYKSFYEKTQIEIELSPYHLHFDRRAWYVMGHSSLHEEVRTFKLSRIKDARMMLSRFVLERPFNIEKYLGNAWGLIPEGKVYHVKLRFLPKVAGNVAEILWHRTQKLTKHKDGSITFEADVDGLGEISWWVMGYADNVEVLEPNELRRRVGQMAERTAKIYE